MEGKRWLADQKMRDATDCWNQFGAAHKFWTFEDMYKHWKKTKEKTRNDSKNNVGTKDFKNISTKPSRKYGKTIQKANRSAWPRSQKLLMSKEEVENEKAA